MENLDLIDWRGVAFGALWITGLAVILSAAGFAYYHATMAGERFRDFLKRPSYQMAINGGLTLLCLGLIGSSNAIWESLLWAALTAAFAWFTFRSFRDRSKNHAGYVDPPESEVDQERQPEE
jgi:hypothetical protein